MLNPKDYKQHTGDTRTQLFEMFVEEELATKKELQAHLRNISALLDQHKVELKNFVITEIAKSKKTQELLDTTKSWKDIFPFLKK